MSKSSYNDALRLLISNVLIMEGGAYGHMSHLYEALDMTFGELLEVLRAASEGKLENVTEKTDGINMFFTVANNGLRVATNPGYVRTGGMDKQQLAQKYEGKPGVQKAYLEGYDALAKTVAGLDDDELKTFFGDENARTWYSIEIITNDLTMTIDYGRKLIAVHMNGSKVVNKDGSEQKEGDHELAVELGSRLEREASSADWDVAAPAMVELPAMSMEAYENAARRIMALGVSESDTIQDYLSRVAESALLANGVRGDVAKQAARKMAGFPNQPNLTTFKRQIPQDAYSLMQHSKEWAKDAILPLEDIVTDFAVERLRGVSSALMDNSQEEVQRLREKVGKAIAAIEASGDANALAVLQREMTKLKSVDNIVTPMEGIVFHHNGRVLKLTGAFSSFHKLLSLFTFGKGGTKLNVEGSSRKITEGGNAFKEAKPVPLSSFNKEYPKLVKMLKSAGADVVVPVGSTGKKKLMGDVDLAVQTNVDVDDFKAKLQDMLGSENVTRNATVVSFVYDFGGSLGQVDLMFGKADYLSWARAGTNPEETPFKGIVRNILLNTLAKVLSRYVFTKQQGEGFQKRYSIDLDRGLYVNTQTNVSKDGKKLSSWKTVDKEFLTDDPNEIVNILLGADYSVDDTTTLEKLLQAIYDSSVTKKYAAEIVEAFADSVTDTLSRKSNAFGDVTVDQVLNLLSKYR